MEHVTATREEGLARESGNRGLVKDLFGYRLELKAYSGEIKDQPSPVVPAL